MDETGRHLLRFLPIAQPLNIGAITATLEEPGLILLFLGLFVFETGNANALVMSLGSNLISVVLIYFSVTQFAQFDPESEQNKKMEATLAQLGQALNAANNKPSEIQLYPTRSSIYDTFITSLETRQWKHLRIYAPVGLWKKDDTEKERWLKTIARCAKNRNVGAVSIVFGLPPLVKRGESKANSIIREELQHVRQLLEHINNIGNIEIHFYPPFPASVAFGSVLLENADSSGGFASFALASHKDDESVDTGFAVNNRELFFITKDWFDQKIFRSTEMFILQDENKPFSTRWPEIVKAWYGEQYVSDVNRG